MPDMNGVFQIGMFDDSRCVSRIMVHVMIVAHLRRTSVTATVMRNDAKSFAQEEQHQRVPVIGAEWPTMMENDRLGILRFPVLIENLYTVGWRDECGPRPASATRPA